MGEQKAIIIVLCVLLFLAVSYIAVLYIGNYQAQKMQYAYNQGAQAGYETAVKQLMQQMAKCEPVPVFAENVTLNAIAVECLQQKPQE